MNSDTAVSMGSVEALLAEAMRALEAADATDAAEAVRLRYLGRSGELTLLKRGLKDLSPEERPAFGQRLNEASETLGAAIDAKKGA